MDVGEKSEKIYPYFSIIGAIMTRRDETFTDHGGRASKWNEVFIGETCNGKKENMRRFFFYT